MTKKRQTREEQYELIRRSQSGDIRATDALINGNIGLITRIAKCYIERCLHLEHADLIQEGKLGMWKAIDRFDITRGVAFSTYASVWVRQSISRAVRSKDRAIYIPDFLLAKGSRDDEILSNIPAVVDSLDRPLPAGFFNSMRVLDQHVAPDNVEAEVLGYTGPGGEIDVLALVERLDELERLILTQRYNLDGRGVRTLGQIGDAIGYSREGVRHAECRAITRLQQYARHFTPRNPQDKEEGR